MALELTPLPKSGEYQRIVEHLKLLVEDGWIGRGEKRYISGQVIRELLMAQYAIEMPRHKIAVLFRALGIPIRHDYRVDENHLIDALEDTERLNRVILDGGPLLPLEYKPSGGSKRRVSRVRP